MSKRQENNLNALIGYNSELARAKKNVLDRLTLELQNAGSLDGFRTTFAVVLEQLKVRELVLERRHQVVLKTIEYARYSDED